MRHNCTTECKCRIDLNASVAVLAEAANLLQSASILFDPEEEIGPYFGLVRVAKAKAEETLDAYLNHLLNDSEPRMGTN
jgi:hypothetical protein